MTYGRSLGLIPAAVLPLMLTGCLSGGGLAGMGAALGGGGSAFGTGGQALLGGTSGGNNFTPSGYTPLGGSGSGPSSLNQPGASNQTPASTLPAPAGSSAQAQQIFKAYGIPIMGAGATPQILDTVAEGLRHYKPENTKGITQIIVQSSRGGSLAGMWSSSGNSAKIELMANSQWRTPVSLQTVTHEIGHHWSLFSDQAAGDAFDQALGNGSAGHATPYSYNSRADKLAEAVALMLIGTQKGEGDTLPGFRPSAQASQVLQASIISGRPSF